jgi:hypothetical protein
MNAHPEHLSIDGLLRDLLFKAQARPGGSLKLLPFILKTTLEQFLGRLNRGRFVSEQVKIESFYVLRIRVTPKKRSRGLAESAVEGDFALFPVEPNIWCFASAERAVIFEKIIFQLLQANVSQTSQIFLSNRDFESIFGGLMASNLTIKVVQHSEYNREESNVTSLKQRRDYRVVFKEITLKNAVIRRIKAAAYRGKGDIALAFSVSNAGILGFRDGALGLFKDLILGSVAEIGLKQNSLFSDRARKGIVLSPLHVLFDHEVLADKTQNLELVRALAAIDRSALTVFHANPYIHCVFTDLRNGSSFNIFSSSTYSLEIVPSIRASVSSLMKLYRGISEKFADCAISDIPEQAPTLADFFGN